MSVYFARCIAANGADMGVVKVGNYAITVELEIADRVLELMRIKEVELPTQIEEES